jgi:hypothetical protein
VLRFLWYASKGYRLRPWASPYWKWRIETYCGIPAESVTAKVFFDFAWRERAALWHYLKWVRRMRPLLRG